MNSVFDESLGKLFFTLEGFAKWGLCRVTRRICSLLYRPGCIVMVKKRFYVGSYRHFTQINAINIMSGITLIFKVIDEV